MLRYLRALSFQVFDNLFQVFDTLRCISFAFCVAVLVRFFFLCWILLSLRFTLRLTNLQSCAGNCWKLSEQSLRGKFCLLACLLAFVVLVLCTNAVAGCLIFVHFDDRCKFFGSCLSVESA